MPSVVLPYIHEPLWSGTVAPTGRVACEGTAATPEVAVAGYLLQ